ncbi:AlwI family type II restriction endonuclease|uniref:AlwI restriction endonuclease n=1 Tax=Dendrosporobacter quercicolus TaxID=146817 RepID=A0A1G9ZLJ7_9FIRM|nr:AlwI family type II restriction endonuclease [Dendrosporobacter quercicolus]NSL49549.1 AlwI family type II restriction endonuclease [Dendrosporobacter quercicolus DSM 1736]SDN22219.1 AlwI restriction endonuclease [Dendrosporobacter quercicolus]
MARLENRALFFTTSPRSPEKMLPEIQLLCEVFDGQVWNGSTQVAFIEKLAESDFFEGSGSPKDKAFSARDRINRAPKALGFVDLNPKLKLTPSGHSFVYGKRPKEVFLRQLLKFQLPSPFHNESKNIAGAFWIRPYLEIMRLICDLESLTFDEFKIFALQLTDYRNFDIVKNSILSFRREKESRRGDYKSLVNEVWTKAVEEIYVEAIASGKARTRQSRDVSIRKFIKTKKGNMRDYADACFRYLRFTGLFSFTGRSIVVSPDKTAEVEYLLKTVERKPVFVEDQKAYKEHLFNPFVPTLYADIRENLMDTLMRLHSYTRRELSGMAVEELKDLRDGIIQKRKNALIRHQEIQLKSYALYQEVVDTFNEIISDELYDAPLFLEWNTWRAMTMMDGGNIKGNFKVDDLGQPMSTAKGNMPDIECDYENFVLAVEVTLQSGQRQFIAEGDSVTRHCGQLFKKTGKDTYCLFIAPAINQATLAHFYTTNKTNVTYYGGKTRIIPLDLDQFMRLIENSYTYSHHPTPKDIESFLIAALAQIEDAIDENDWKNKIQICVDNWLAA